MNKTRFYSAMFGMALTFGIATGDWVLALSVGSLFTLVFSVLDWMVNE